MRRREQKKKNEQRKILPIEISSLSRKMNTNGRICIIKCKRTKIDLNEHHRIGLKYSDLH